MDDYKLIQLVQSHTVLYDKSHPHFKNKEKKKRAWRDIANNLGVSEHLAMRRWCNFRERFSKEIRLGRRRSKSGVHSVVRWPLFERLLFLKKHIIPRPMRQSNSFSTAFIKKHTDDEIASPTTSSSGNFTFEEVLCLAPRSPTLTAPSTPINKKEIISTQDEEVEHTNLTAGESFQKVFENSSQRMGLSSDVGGFGNSSQRMELSADISGFGTMICSVISKLRKKNQARVMQYCTEIVMQARMEEDDD